MPRLNWSPGGGGLAGDRSPTRTCPGVVPSRRADVEAGRGERGPGLGERLAGQVGHHDEVDALRRHDRHRRARAATCGRRRPAWPTPRCPAGTVVAEHAARRRRRRAASPRAAAVASATVSPTSVGIGPRRRAGRHDERRPRCRAAPRRRRRATASAGTDQEITEPTGTSSSNCCVAGRATRRSSASVVSASVSGQAGEVRAAPGARGPR